MSITSDGVIGECGCCGACCDDCSCCADVSACSTLVIDLTNFSESAGSCGTVYADILDQSVTEYVHSAPYPGGVDPESLGVTVDCAWIAGPIEFDTVYTTGGGGPPLNHCNATTVEFYFYFFCNGVSWYVQPVQSSGTNLGLLGAAAASETCSPLSLVFNMTAQFSVVNFEIELRCD